MAWLNSHTVSILVVLFLLGTVISAKSLSFPQGSEERERNVDNFGDGPVFQSRDSLGGGNLLRAIYRNERSRDFLRTGRGLDSLSGAAFGLAKRGNKLDSLSGMTFGTAKRNFDEIDRTNFGAFVKKNFDEIDRSDFGRFVKKREVSSHSLEANPE